MRFQLPVYCFNMNLFNFIVIYYIAQTSIDYWAVCVSVCVCVFV